LEEIVEKNYPSSSLFFSSFHFTWSPQTPSWMIRKEKIFPQPGGRLFPLFPPPLFFSPPSFSPQHGFSDRTVRHEAMRGSRSRKAYGYCTVTGCLPFLSISFFFFEWPTKSKAFSLSPPLPQKTARRWTNSGARRLRWSPLRFLWSSGLPSRIVAQNFKRRLDSQFIPPFFPLSSFFSPPPFDS